MRQRGPRGASSKYQKLYRLKEYRQGRVAFLARKPWCVFCEQTGKKTPASVVNHIKPHKGDSTLFLARSNWQPVCAPCHNRLCKLQDEGKPIPGCDERGEPLDKADPWWTR